MKGLSAALTQEPETRRFRLQIKVLSDVEVRYTDIERALFQQSSLPRVPLRDRL